MKNNVNKLILLAIILLIIIGVLYSLNNTKYLQKISNKITKNKLVCEVTTQDGYNIKYETSFNNKEVSKVIITYINKNGINNEGYSSTESQIDYFCALPGTTMEYINNDLYITINKEAYEKNKKDGTIKSMFGDYNSIKAYYTKLGYTCE